MKQLNVVRLVLAGLVSAIILYVFEGVTNAVILAGPWKSWGLIADRAFVMPSPGTSLMFWGLQALVGGLVAAFVYTAIRAWVGVNLRAAWLSAVVVWGAGWLGMTLDKMAMGLEPPILMYGNLLAALLGLLVGQIAGSFIYKDNEA